MANLNKRILQGVPLTTNLVPTNPRRSEELFTRQREEGLVDDLHVAVAVLRRRCWHVMPRFEKDGWCHQWCLAPSEKFIMVLYRH